MKNDAERQRFERFYLGSSLAGTNPLSACAIEPTYLSADGGGTITFPNRVAVLSAGRHLESPDIWCARVPAAGAVQVFLMGLGRGTSADSLLFTVGNDHIGHLMPPFVFYGAPDSVEPEPSHRGLIASIWGHGARGESRQAAEHVAQAPTARISRELIDILHMSAGEISNMLNISDRGYRNWLAGARIRLPNEKRLLWLRQLAKLVESGRGQGNVREWFMTPADGVNAPFDLVKSGKFAEVAAIAATQFERKAQPRQLDSATATRMGFPFDMLEGDEDDLKDLDTVLNRQ